MNGYGGYSGLLFHAAAFLQAGCAFPVLVGGNAHNFFKGLRKIGLGGKTGDFSDFCYRIIGGFQQIPGFLQPSSYEIINRRRTPL